MDLEGGFGRREITPDRSLSLVGYSQRVQLHGSGNAGVLDPLYVRVLALAYGTERLLLVSLDLCVLTQLVVQTWRAHLAAALSFPLNGILLTSTHTHSGPHPRVAGMNDEVFQLATQTIEADLHYGELVLAQAVEAAGEALRKLKPHTAFWNGGCLGLGYNRRVPTRRGIQMCWNPREDPELVPSPSPDPHCGALIFRDNDGGEIVLWSAGAHPVVLGKESNVVSADWPGFACNELERLHPGRSALFVLAPCGEVHPWISTQSDPEGIRTVGTAAASFVHLLSQGAQTSLPAQLKGVSLIQNGMSLTAWNICGVILLGAPVELFAILSAQLRRALDGPLLIATLANGWYAYFPDRTSFTLGAYEVEVALSCGRKSGEGEELIAHLEALARTVLEGIGSPSDLRRFDDDLVDGSGGT